MKKITTLLGILVLITGFTLFFFSYPQNGLIEFLSKSARVNATMLVVEGWLPDYAMEKVVDEINKNSYDQILTTGIISSELDYCLTGMNGFLIFYPKFPPVLKEVNDSHWIEVVAKSEMGGFYSCHINIYINNIKVADDIIDNKSNSYGVSWYGSVNNIDSIMVHFDNDMVDEKGDRNLYVKEIIIDNTISIPYQFNSVYDIGQLDNTDRIVNDYESVAEFARIRLKLFGIDTSKIVPMPAKRKRFNRTLSSVLAVHNWLEMSNMSATSLNIITLGIHSRRTYLTYKSILGKSCTVGIIAIPNSSIPDSEKPGSKKILLETIQLLYYWIILLPYNIT